MKESSLRKKKYVVVLLCSVILGTFANTVLAVETSNSDPSQNEEGISKVNDTSKDDEVTPKDDLNESGSKQSTAENPVSSETKEKSDANTDENDEQTNHKMGTYAKGYTETLGRRMLRAVDLPIIYSNDDSLPRRDVVDISSWQSWMTQNDFNLLKSQGVKAICIKLTEGTTYKNTYAANQIKMAKNAGLVVSVYHYSTFSSTVGAIAEANYFANRATELGLSKGTLMVNDAEDEKMDTDNVDATKTSNTFAQQLKNNGFTNVLHYASESWVGIGKFKLEYDKMGGINNFWIAQYDYSKPSSSKLKWQDKGGAWQYSSKMVLAGGSTSKFLDVSIDYKGRFTASGTEGGEGAIYRLYNPNNYEHYYTPNFSEVNALVQQGWGEYEGISWYAPKTGQPVYRLYQPGFKDHHYTMSTNERDTLVAKHGWQYEGIAWYSDNDKKAPVYRAYNAGLQSGSHNYTGDAYEQRVLTTQRGWKDEGIAWYALKIVP